MSSKLTRTLALALAGGSLAVGVPAALAASGGGGAPAEPTAPAFIQDEQAPQQQPDREDCPERGGGGSGESGSGESGSGESGSGATGAPSV